MTMAKKFDAAEALARLKNAQYRQSISDSPMSTIAEIDYAALAEIGRRDAKVAEQQATDDTAYQVWFAKTHCSNWVSASMLAAWQECSRRAAVTEQELQAKIEELERKNNAMKASLVEKDSELEVLTERLLDDESATMGDEREIHRLQAELAETEKSRQATDVTAAFMKWASRTTNLSAGAAWRERDRLADAVERGTRAEVERLREELCDGDYWMERSKAFHECGGCPVCFATDEAGHTTNCPWGKDEAEIEVERARTTAELATYRQEHEAALAVVRYWRGWENCCESIGLESCIRHLAKVLVPTQAAEAGRSSSDAG